MRHSRQVRSLTIAGSFVPEARRKPINEGLAGVECAGALDENVLGLGNVGIGDAAIDRANRGALLLVEEADALSAFGGNDVIDVLFERRVLFAVQFPVRAASYALSS